MMKRREFYLFKFIIISFMTLYPLVGSAQIDMDKQLRDREKKEDTYDDSDADRHGDNMTSYYLVRRLGDKKSAFVDTLKLNYFHRAFIEGLSNAEAYTGTFASPYQSKIYFDRPLNKWDSFFFTNPYNHLIHRGERQQWYDVKVPYTFLKYTTTGSTENQEQNFNFKFTTNLGPQFNFGGDFDIDHANGYYAFSKSKNVTYRLFASYHGDRYTVHASIGNTNTVNQENGGITDHQFITNPENFSEGKRNLLPKDIPTKYKSTWNRVVYGEGRLHHKYSLGFYKVVDEKGNFIEKKDQVKNENNRDTISDKVSNNPPLPNTDLKKNDKEEPHPGTEKNVDKRDNINTAPNTPNRNNTAEAIDIANDSNQLVTPPARKRLGKSSGQQLAPEEKNEIKKELPKKIFIPVTSFFHDFSLEKGRRSWTSQDPIFSELYPDPIIPRPNGSKYFPNDRFYAKRISNSVGIELMEGFHKWAKMGIAAFVAFDHEQFRQPLIHKEDAERLEIEQEVIEQKQNTTYVGGRISSNSFRYFKYYVWGQLGIAGAKAGELEVNGELSSQFVIMKREIITKANINILNTPPSYYLRHYKASLHQWDQDMDMIQLLRVGGEVLVPFTQTKLHANFETVQNPIKVNDKAQPEQVKANNTILAIGIDQKISWRFINLENSIIWQRSSQEKDITPLPTWAIYSNFYFQTLISKVMTLQLGVDAKWHSKYHAPYYEPSTQFFVPQDKIEIGGDAPLLSLYANVHLKRARFFAKYYNIGALVFKPNYFSMPYYPLYPPVLRLGIAVDLRN